MFVEHIATCRYVESLSTINKQKVALDTLTVKIIYWWLLFKFFWTLCLPTSSFISGSLILTLGPWWISLFIKKKKLQKTFSLRAINPWYEIHNYKSHTNTLESTILPSFYLNFVYLYIGCFHGHNSHNQFSFLTTEISTPSGIFHWFRNWQD